MALLVIVLFMAVQSKLKAFQSGVQENKLDYSGYNMESWKVRTDSDHRLHAEEFLRARTKCGQKQLVSEHGLHYSVLLLLPYLNIVCMHIVDPMHNLLLGTAKHVTEIWINENKLGSTDFSKIHEIVSEMKTPKQVSRIASKIALQVFLQTSGETGAHSTLL